MAKTSTSKKIYIDNDSFRLELISSNVNGALTPRALQMMMLLVERVQSSFTYVDPQDKEDCASHAIEVILKNWHKYDADRYNAFAYFTRMTMNGLFAGWNLLAKSRCQHSLSNIFTEST